MGLLNSSCWIHQSDRLPRDKLRLAGEPPPPPRYLPRDGDLQLQSQQKKISFSRKHSKNITQEVTRKIPSSLGSQIALANGKNGIRPSTCHHALLTSSDLLYLQCDETSVTCIQSPTKSDNQLHN